MDRKRKLDRRPTIYLSKDLHARCKAMAALVGAKKMEDLVTVFLEAEMKDLESIQDAAKRRWAALVGPRR